MKRFHVFGDEAKLESKTAVTLQRLQQNRIHAGGIQIPRTLYGRRQFFVRMNGEPWPKDGRPVSVTRLMTALRKSLVKFIR